MFCATTIRPTPLFNRNDLPLLFSLPFQLDQRGLLLALETILYPGVTVTYKEEGEIVAVETEDYPSREPLFTHRRFLEEAKPTKRERERPTKKKMLETLESTPFLPYIWGGNFPEGVPEIFELFPPQRELHAWEWQLLHLRGFDCSGLIYYVTHGTIPRNTGPMREVCQEITAPSKPLDLIFSPGHVMITLSSNLVMEARRHQGITVTPLSIRLRQLEIQGEPISFGRFA